MEPIPILSAPFLTSEKNVFHPRPIIARKTMITIIHTKTPIDSMIDTHISFNNYAENPTLYCRSK